MNCANPKEFVDTHITPIYKIKLVSDELKKISSSLSQIIPVFNLTDFYFAGGCVYSLWNEKEVKDYDIFCTNIDAIKKLHKFFRDNKLLVNVRTENAYTVGKYQFVVKHIGNAYDEVAQFDFKHNCYYYDNSGLHSLYGWSYISSNKLVFNSERARDVLNIITRIPKFVGRGMEINQSEILNIIEVGTKPSKYIQERKSIKQRLKGKNRY